jgi:tetratricopeptide (TPR) repeat protein
MPALKLFFCLILFVLFSGPLHAANPIQALYEQAQNAYAAKEYDQAIELYQQITKIAPNFGPAYVGIGLSLKDKGGDIDEVLYYYKTATEMDPGNASAYEQLARLYYALNKFDKAEKNFQQALKIDPNLASAKLSLGWIYLMAKSKPETAIRYFQDVIKISPVANAYFGLGMAYFSSNQRVKAMEVITTLKKMGEQDFASRLETLVRENRKIVTDPVQAEEKIAAADPAVEAQAPTNPPAAQTAQQEPAQTPPAETGMKVRLNGRLNDLD